MIYNRFVLVANAAKAVLDQEAPTEGGYAYEKAHCLVYNPNNRYDGSIAPCHERNSRLSFPGLAAET